MITAAAAPCTTRKPISTAGLGARAHATDATVNPTTPRTNTRRRPAMSPSRPPVTSSTANGRV